MKATQAPARCLSSIEKDFKDPSTALPARLRKKCSKFYKSGLHKTLLTHIVVSEVLLQLLLERLVMRDGRQVRDLLLLLRSVGMAQLMCRLRVRH